MALDPVPWFIGGGAQHSSAVARLLAYATFKGNEGIIGSLDLRVHQQTVAAGSVVVDPGAAAVLQFNPSEPYGMYVTRELTAETVAITPTGGAVRSDLIVLRIENPFITGESWSVPSNVAVGPYAFIRVISGVPNTTTSLRQVTGHTTQSGIALARIDIPASTTNITDAMITDLRVPASGTPQGTWVAFTPTWTNITVGNAVQECRYTQIGKLVIAKYKITLGTTSVMGTTPTATLPVTPHAGVAWTSGAVGVARDVSASAAFNVNIIHLGSFVYFLRGATEAHTGVSAAAPFAWTTGDFLTGTVVYEAA